MSYAEVERGLPSVNEVSEGTWRSPRHDDPLLIHHSNWATITPNESTTNSAVSTPRPKRRDIHPLTLSSNQIESSDGEAKETPALLKVNAPSSPVTQRYIIQDEDDDDMKVIKLDPEASMPNTLEVQKPRKSKPMLTRQNKSSSLQIPTVRVSAASNGNNGQTPSPNTKWIARRAKHFIVILLILLPPLFFALTMHYLKFKMAAYGILILGLCIFQGILWPSLIFTLFNKMCLKLEVVGSIRQGWLQLLILTILSSGAILMQIVSLIHLNITISLAMNFAPLVIVAFIRNINQQKTFPIVLCLTSVLTYVGLTLIGVSCLHYPLFKGDQDTFLIGLGASVGSLMLTIPSCFLLIKLRRKEVDDSITATLCTSLGTGICLIGIVIGFNPSNGVDVDPGTVSSAITFVFFGTLFQYIESKINPQWEKTRDAALPRSVHKTLRGQRYRTLRLSRTRIGIFILSGLWELIKWGINKSGISYAPSAFSIFGVCFILIGYTATVSYEFWLMK